MGEVRERHRLQRQITQPDERHRLTGFDHLTILDHMTV